MSEKALKRYIGKYVVLHFFTGAIQCTYSVFILMFLRSKGINDFESGLVIAFNALSGVGGRALFSYLSDKIGAPKRVVLAVLFLQAVLVIPFAFDFNKYILMGVSVIYHFAACTSPSLTEGWFFHNASGIAERYSLLYLSNVVAVTIFGAANGFLVNRFGWNFLLILTLIQLSMQIFVAFTIQDRPAPPLNNGEIEEKVSFRVLVCRKKYVFVIIWLTITSIFTMIIASFLPVTVESVGGNTGDYGFVRAVMYLLTIPLLLRGRQVVSKFSTPALFLASCLFYSAAGFVNAAATAVWMTAIGASCQGMGGIIGHMAIKHYISRTMPHNVAIMAQSVADAMYLGIAAVLAGMMGGILTQTFSIGTAMFICGITSVIAGAVITTVAFVLKQKGQTL